MRVSLQVYIDALDSEKVPTVSEAVSYEKGSRAYEVVSLEEVSVVRA